MLILNSNHIKESVSPLEILEAVEQAMLLQESGDFNMPDRLHLEKNNNVLLLMPALAGNYFSTKLVSVFPDNKKLKQPVIYGTVILNDGNTGKPLAMLDGTTVTALRTGAVGALGIAYTTPKNVESIGLFGAGYQGFHQLMFACIVRNIKQVFIYDPYNKDIELFKNQLTDLLPHINFVIEKKAEKTISKSEAIITATTSQTPVLPNNKEFLEGKHFIGLGSFKPDMREFPDELFQLLKEVIIDTDHAKHESGDIRIPLSSGKLSDTQIVRLGQVINNEINIDENSTTFFKSVGMALFDLLTAETIYEKALEKGIGTEVEM